jgi:single-stranded-DNA-specific exonuclease
MSDIVFKIGPRINASGRMMNGREAVDLLVERDLHRGLTLAMRINEYNEQRKDVDKQMTVEANEIVERLESQQHLQSIVLYDEGWKKGVVGIVASRLTELYFRPTVVLTIIDGMASGSARSVAGFDVYDAVKSCRDLLENFGGHTYAVGLTMRQENIPEFRRRFQEYVDNHILPEQTQQTLDIDMELDFQQINKRLLNELKRLAPHGPGNNKPLFITRNVFDYGTSKVVGRHQEHIKLELVDSKSAMVMNGIAFGQSAAARYIKSKRSFDIVYTIEENTYKRGEIQLQIEGIRPSEED